jgi:hypothetical protein
MKLLNLTGLNTDLVRELLTPELLNASCPLGIIHFEIEEGSATIVATLERKNYGSLD